MIRGNREAWKDQNAGRADQKELKDLNGGGRGGNRTQDQKRRLGPALCAALLALSLCACQSLKKAAAPIAIFDAQIVERDCVGVEFVAANLSGRPIKSAVFEASVQEALDESGAEKEFGAAFSEGSLSLESGLEAGGEERLFIPFEDLGTELDADSVEIESLRVTRALFEDGEVWDF